MHSSKRAQIAYLKADEAPTKVLSENADFADVFSQKLTAKLLKYAEINYHAIKFVNDCNPYTALSKTTPCKIGNI